MVKELVNPYPGVIVRLKDVFIEDGEIKMSLVVDIKWYAWPILLWKKAHEKFEIKWHQYSKLLMFIAWYSLTKIFHKGGVGGSNLWEDRFRNRAGSLLRTKLPLFR